MSQLHHKDANPNLKIHPKDKKAYVEAEVNRNEINLRRRIEASDFFPFLARILLRTLRKYA